jgi:hypothetical protein
LCVEFAVVKVALGQTSPKILWVSLYH